MDVLTLDKWARSMSMRLSLRVSSTPEATCSDKDSLTYSFSCLLRTAGKWIWLLIYTVPLYYVVVLA